MNFSKNLKMPTILLIVVIFMLFLTMTLVQKKTTGEIAKIISADVENKSILIVNLGGQEKNITVSNDDLKIIDFGKTYFIEYRSYFGKKPKLLTYQLIDYSSP
ncbi:hypothetical protein [Cohnella panacarvi]|uniref:hypothetical protein n=1 Tax=Cohnella panacarvi TaxID=400776 RepID=UPI00047D59AA|nr:hypothetical protein [Cohnella panacarvi]